MAHHPDEGQGLQKQVIPVEGQPWKTSPGVQDDHVCEAGSAVGEEWPPNSETPAREAHRGSHGAQVWGQAVDGFHR